ncbi:MULTISPECIES: TetR/AcrR family transcriptional regulator [unclassified Marinovum]|uniref:TetR/AcrR family transcriptional regulator n=1 Tax=unclassified Marinovum TaxID=2647166 RepID=UPI0026E1A871|nr:MULTISPECIES: TetR/AcrR family transcriptional regulator [unclassified Marinovum]MDO6780196.1 TetR/AcrR family transcriptional regulator [Marinovum sp. 1_MG-2023]
MTDTMGKISAGLERAFASRGFAEPSVDDLRDAAGVSLRTLYKYTPSRAEMVLAALEFRHRRYLVHVFDGLPSDPQRALDAIFGRVGDWMATETAHGCLFHAAVAADPGSAPLRGLLDRHKAEVAQRAAEVCDLARAEDGQQTDAGTAFLLILEGLTQTWPLRGRAAVDAAKQLGQMLHQSAH